MVFAFPLEDVAGSRDASREETGLLIANLDFGRRRVEGAQAYCPYVPLCSEESAWPFAPGSGLPALQFDYDDLNGRAGNHSWGYVEPSKAAGELLEEALEPFVNDMKQHLEMGLEDQASQFCQGILLGLYRVRDGRENEILNWVLDFPGEAAANALKVWSETGGAERGSAPVKKRRR